ncbi:MAG: hypothetical protein F7C34_01355 [Desulfurococcales archaeon]|nr:hypothetical protein [Desulfurococcales archaeon]
MRSRIMRALAMLILVALMGMPVLTAVASPQGTSDAGAESMAEKTAEIYVKRITIFVNHTLRIAENHNITLPSDLEEKVNTTLTLLAWARANLSTNVTLAVELATKASIEFAPVADYVWNNLPSDVKKEMQARAMEIVINKRIEMLTKLEEKLRMAQNLSGVNMSRLIEAINITIAKLEEAKHLLEQGNITGARIIMAKALKEAKHEVRISYRVVYKEAWKCASLNILTLKLVDHVFRLADAINRTIQAVNETGNVSEDIIAGLAARNRALYNMAVRILERYPAPENTSDPVYTTLEEIVAALNTSQMYLDLAVNASEAGNPAWVETNLTLALDVLVQALNETKNLQMPLHALKRAEKAVHIMERIRSRMEHMRASKYAAISIMLDRKFEHLQRMYERYQNGMIPEWRIRAVFTAEKLELEQLKASLPPDTPEWLIEKIDSIIQWIDTHMP